NAALKADYFDNEGHVIRYLVEARAPDVVTFVSDPGAREPRYRLTYRREPDGTLAGSFEVAAPGSPDAFTPYLAWKARKRWGVFYCERQAPSICRHPSTSIWI